MDGAMNRRNMDEQLIEIREYHGEGYKPLIDSGEWRVAILRPVMGAQPKDISSVERHTQSDEVFILIKGYGILFIGEGMQDIENLTPLIMEHGVLYNIKRNTWHTIFLSQDADVVIVENRNTSTENSQFSPLKSKQQEMVYQMAISEQEKWHKSNHQ
jgi:ureidoglycolate hydrolase